MTNFSKCTNCGLLLEDIHIETVMADIPNFFERVDPGGIVPSGECPACYALMYPTDQKVVVWNHVSSVCFTVRSLTQDGSDISKEMLLQALKQRIRDIEHMDESEAIECFGLPDDSYQEEAD